MASGLPDFVQDHLVVEQCYNLNNGGNGQQLYVDLENIQHFQTSGADGDGGSGSDMPFDLMAEPSHRLRGSGSGGGGGGGGGPGGNPGSPAPPPHQRLPFDLPSEAEGSGSTPDSVGPSKSLPDFLSDGPIRRSIDHLGSSEPSSSGPSPPDHRQLQSDNTILRIENERLRRELDALRRQVSDQILRSESLERELNVRILQHSSDHGHGHGHGHNPLQSIVDQLNEEAKHATKRAVAAECKLEQFRQENQSLRSELEAYRSGGCRIRDTGPSTSAQQTEKERLASQLRNAANTAEPYLRHLLLGVENLRLLASSLETTDSTASGSSSRGHGGPGGSRSRDWDSDESMD